MKRIRISALMLALALCFSLVLASCDKLKQKDLEKDPVGQIESAVRTTSEGLSERVDLFDVLRSAREKGVVSFKLDNGELGIAAEGKSAYDSGSKRFSGQFSLSANGDNVSLDAFADDTRVAVSSPELFEGVYGIDISTLENDLRESGILKAFRLDEDGILGAISRMTEALNADGDSDLAETFEKTVSDVKARLDGAEHTVEKKDVTVCGETLKAYEVAIRLTKTDLADIFDIIKKDTEPFENVFEKLTAFMPSTEDGSFDAEGLKDAFDEAIDTLKKDDNEANADLTFILGPENAELLAVRFEGGSKIGGDSSEFEFSLDLGAEPAKSDKAIGAAKFITVTDGVENRRDVSFTLDRADSEKGFSRKLTVKTTEQIDGVTDGFDYVIDFGYDKETKTYECTLGSVFRYDADGTSGETRSDVSFGGPLEYTDTSLSFGVKNVKVTEDSASLFETEDLGLSVSVAPYEEVGAMPEYTNIAALGFEGVMDLYIEIQNNSSKLTGIADKLGELFGTSPDAFDGPAQERYEPEDILDVYDEYDEKYDYNFDGKVDDDDRTAWDEGYRPYGEEYDPDYDYDYDGKNNTDADREEYDLARKMITGEYVSEEFLLYYAEFNEEYDYDGDGETGTDADRADYEAYYKPYADEFDPERDYDGDGIADRDDRDYYDYIRTR